MPHFRNILTKKIHFFYQSVDKPPYGDRRGGRGWSMCGLATFYPNKFEETINPIDCKRCIAKLSKYK